MNTGSLLLALFATAALAAPALAQTRSFDESFAMQGGATYVVRLRQEQAARLNDRSFRLYGHWGAEGAQPSFCVSSFKVNRRGAAVAVSGKAFADLCNVRSVQLSERKGVFVLSLRGGDAGDSFAAEFLFRGVFLVERMVRHGEFPDAYERTLYRYTTYEN